MASASSHLPLGRLLILSIAMIYRTWQRLGVDLLYDLPLAKTMKLSVHQHTSAKKLEINKLTPHKEADHPQNSTSGASSGLDSRR